MKSDQQIFYVYVYLDPRKPGDHNYGEYHFDYEPFYVGKGKNKRLYKHLQPAKLKNGENKSFTNKIMKIQCVCGIDPIIIKCQEMLEEQVALNLEVKIVGIIGRLNILTGPLCNLTEAGDGISGYKHTDDTKRKIGKSLKGLQAGINNPMYGKHHTEEVREKLSLKLSGENHPMFGKHPLEETKRKNREWHNGKHCTIGTKRKMSESHLGEKNVMYGKKHSEETIKKISMARLEYLKRIECERA